MTLNAQSLKEKNQQIKLDQNIKLLLREMTLLREKILSNHLTKDLNP